MEGTRLLSWIFIVLFALLLIASLIRPSRMSAIVLRGPRTPLVTATTEPSTALRLSNLASTWLERERASSVGPDKDEYTLLRMELRVDSNKDNKDLANLNVLVVEDEPAIAMGIADQMEKAGASVVGPCSTVGGAMAALDESKIDVAIVDYVLADDNSESLQDALEEKGVPFLVITGYPRVLVRRSQRQPVLSKPVAPEVLAATLKSLSRADGSG